MFIVQTIDDINSVVSVVYHTNLGSDFFKL